MVYCRDNYFYHEGGFENDGNTRRFICSQRQTKRCLGAAALHIDSGEFEETHNHNHDGNDNVEIKQQFLNAAKNYAQTTFWTTHEIYEKLVSETRFEEVPFMYPYKDIKSEFNNKLRYASDKTILKAPKILSDMEKILNNDENKNMLYKGNAKMKIIHFDTADGSEGLLISDKNLMKKIIINNRRPDISFGSTNIVLPKLNKSTASIIVIAGANHNNNVYPFAWIVLNGVSKRIKTIAIKKFKELYDFQEATFYTCNEWSPILQEFYNPHSLVQIHLSFFELCKIAVMKSRKLPQIDLKNNVHLATLAKIVSIGLMDPDDIISGRCYLQSLLNEENENLQLSFHPLISALGNFFGLLQQSSCFENIISCSTTTLQLTRELQNYHELKKQVQTVVDPWKFFRYCLSITDIAHDNIEYKKTGKRVTQFPKVQPFSTSAQINKLWSYDITKKEGAKMFFNDCVSIIVPFLKDIDFLHPQPPTPAVEIREDTIVSYCVKCLENEAEYIVLPCCHLLFCSDCAKDQSICCECNVEIVEKQKIFFPKYEGQLGRMCMICDEHRRKMMAKNCKQLSLCPDCWNKWIENKTALYQEEFINVPLENDFPCSTCLGKSGGWLEIRFPKN